LLVVVAPVIIVGAPATGLTVASSGRLSRWLSPRSALTGRASTVAVIAAGTGDLLLLAGCAVLLLLPGPRPSSLFLLAAGASVARLVLLCLLARSLTPRHTLPARPRAA